MAKISGILKDGAGQIINDCTIELYAKKTTDNVLVQTQAFAVASDGKYSINAQPCEYDVSLIVNGFPKKRLGTINVYSDSVDGTLNDYLINPEASDLTPEFLKQVFDARSEAKNSAIDSEKSAKKSADSANAANASETNAKSSADAAKASADEATICSQSASESATTATDASTSAKSHSDSAKSYADSASASATASHNSAQQSSNSANAASSSERNAKTSEMNAAKSAEDAKSWASTVDNSNFIKKTGADSQSIDGELMVGTLSANEKINASEILENGNRVYSPNNKPTADDVGALSVTLNNEDGKKEIDSFLRFKKRPEFNNSDILTRDDYVGLLNENGYQKLPSGLIIQWGMANSPDRTGIVIPPIAFPNRVLSVHFTDTAGSASGGAVPISWVLNSTSVNGFAWCATEPPGFFSFFAIGF